MTDNRVDPPFEADERTTLTAFLDFLRDTLAFKCDGLTDDQPAGAGRAAVQPVPPGPGPAHG